MSRRKSQTVVHTLRIAWRAFSNCVKYLQHAAGLRNSTSNIRARTERKIVSIRPGPVRLTFNPGLAPEHVPQLSDMYVDFGLD